MIVEREAHDMGGAGEGGAAPALSPVRQSRQTLPGTSSAMIGAGARAASPVVTAASAS